MLTQVRLIYSFKYISCQGHWFLRTLCTRFPIIFLARIVLFRYKYFILHEEKLKRDRELNVTLFLIAVLGLFWHRNFTPCM